MSIGGLLGNENLLEDARNAGVRVYLPSGALCGIDGLKSASAGLTGARSAIVVEVSGVSLKSASAGTTGASSKKSAAINSASLKSEMKGAIGARDVIMVVNVRVAEEGLLNPSADTVLIWMKNILTIKIRLFRILRVMLFVAFMAFGFCFVDVTKVCRHEGPGKLFSSCNSC